MKGGGNRLPTAVKKARGTLQKCRTNKAEPKLDPSKVPPPPRGCGPVFRRKWRELARAVEALGVFTLADLPAFDLLVRMMTEVVTAPDDMPATARVRLMQATAGQLAAFGLSPASRGRVDRVTAPAADPTLDFMFGRAPRPNMPAPKETA